MLFLDQPGEQVDGRGGEHLDKSGVFVDVNLLRAVAAERLGGL